jgi:hypothetical protein
LLAPFLAGVLGNLAGLFAYSPAHHGLGASGMVLGALGLLSAQSLSLFRRGLAPKFLAVRAVLSGCLLLLLLGANPGDNVDLVAHLVGFLAGLGFGCALAWAPPRLTDPGWCNHLAFGASALLVAIPWGFALRSTHV